MAKYGYVAGPRRVVTKPVGNTGAITEGDILIADAGAGLPYVMRATDGANNPVGVAMESAAAPTLDGDVSIQVDISQESHFRFHTITGTLTEAMETKNCDIGVSGTEIGLDVTASTDDVIHIIEADTVAQDAICTMVFAPAGVV